MKTSRAKNALTAIAVCLGLSGPAKAEVSIDTSPVVQVVCENSKGSAIKVGDTTYISVAHVVQAKGCKIEGTPVAILQLDSKDFAVLQGPRLEAVGVASYSCKGFSRDREYLAVGYGFGWPRLMHQPLRASAFSVKHEPYQMFTGEVIPGMSGGAVFDTRGRVVGVVNMRYPARSLPLSETTLCKKGL